MRHRVLSASWALLRRACPNPRETLAWVSATHEEALQMRLSRWLCYSNDRTVLELPCSEECTVVLAIRIRGISRNRNREGIAGENQIGT